MFKPKKICQKANLKQKFKTKIKVLKVKTQQKKRRKFLKYGYFN